LELSSVISINWPVTLILPKYLIYHSLLFTPIFSLASALLNDLLCKLKLHQYISIYYCNPTDILHIWLITISSAALIYVILSHWDDRNSNHRWKGSNMI
jgi:hypothetical protein